MATTVDLNAIRQATQLRFPVIAVVSEMETHRGFLEVVRRLSPEQTMRRFGKGCDLWSTPTSDQIEAVVINACAAFEDHAYELFGAPEDTHRRGNIYLYSLLCEVRNAIQKSLSDILAGAHALDSHQNLQRIEPSLFGGCYFAATGSTEDRQAFVHDVIQRLIDSENEIAWCEDAITDDRRDRRIANGLAIACGLMIISWAVMITAWLTK